MEQPSLVVVTSGGVGFGLTAGTSALALGSSIAQADLDYRLDTVFDTDGLDSCAAKIEGR